MLKISDKIKALGEEIPDGEKKKLLKKIENSVGRKRNGGVAASIVLSIMFAAAFLVLALYLLAYFAGEEERELLLGSLPLYRKVYDFAALRCTNIVSTVLFFAVVGFVLPIVCAYVVRFIVRFIPVRIGKAIEKTTIPEQFSVLCSDKHYFHESLSFNAAAFIPILYYFINRIIFDIRSGQFADGDSSKAVASYVVVLLVAFVISGAVMLALFRAEYKIAVYGAAVPYPLRSELDGLWLKNDPDEKARRDARHEKEYEAYHRRKAEEEKKPTITFFAEGTPVANQFTVYVDGVRTVSFYGGMNKTVPLTVGHHKVEIQLYNAALKVQENLEPIELDFEEYGRYEINYRK